MIGEERNLGRNALLLSLNTLSIVLPNKQNLPQTNNLIFLISLTSIRIIFNLKGVFGMDKIVLIFFNV